jgi:hypothetical protein
MKTKKTDIIEKNAEIIYQALISPIKHINRTLKRKLKGDYKFHLKDIPKEIKGIDGGYGNFTFPGTCIIKNEISDRSITISIRFYWGKRKKEIRIETIGPKGSLEFIFKEYNRKEKTYCIVFEELKNNEFIDEIKSWLDGKDINIRKWEK